MTESVTTGDLIASAHILGSTSACCSYTGVVSYFGLHGYGDCLAQRRVLASRLFTVHIHGSGPSGQAFASAEWLARCMLADTAGLPDVILQCD